MRKRALSPPPDHFSSSSSSSSRQLCARFQLLHDLPAPLFSVVCSFLTLYQVVSILRSTCRTLHDSVSEDCLQHHHLAVTDNTLPSLLSSQPQHARAASPHLVPRHPSPVQGQRLEFAERDDVAVVTAAGCAGPRPTSCSPSLSSLYINVHEISRQRARTPPKLRSLLSLLRLLAANPQLFSSLRRLHIEDDCDVMGKVFVPLPAPELGRLQGLTHFRIRLRNASALSCPSLVSALSSMQYLTFLHLDESNDDWRQLLPLLCADAATPLLLRLRSLVLPRVDSDDMFDEQHDAFLCRLSALPAPPALQRFSGMNVSHRAAGLLSLFSLPHLTQLTLPGAVRPSQLSVFVSCFTFAPAPLVSLMLPCIQPEHGDEDEAALAEAAAAVCTSVRLLLSRLTALRRLSCATAMVDGATSFIDSMSGDGVSGCSASLYSLIVRIGRPSRCPFTARLSFPLLTELNADWTMTDAQLELLLSGCPQLLVLGCSVWSSCWRAALIAARCCRRLLRLAVTANTGSGQGAQQARDEGLATAAVEPAFSGPFLPELVSLSLTDTGEPRPQPELSLLQHFTTSPRSELRHVALVGVGLTAQHVLSLACLSGLSYFDVRRDCRRSWKVSDIAEVEEARWWARQLSSRGAAACADRDAHVPIARQEKCEGSVHWRPPALGPHQQQEMKLRVPNDTEELGRSDNLLPRVAGVHPDTARAVFFDALRSVLTAPAASESVAAKDDSEGGRLPHRSADNVLQLQ